MLPEDLRWLSDTVGEIYASRTASELNVMLAGLLHSRFHGSVTLAESFSLDFAQYSCEGAISSITMMKGYEPYILDNPILDRMTAGDPSRVMRATESPGQLLKTEFFNNLCEPHGIRDQIAIVVRNKRQMHTFGILGADIYRQSEKLLLELLHPHLAKALQRVHEGSGFSSGTSAVGWIEVSSEMKPIGISIEQRAILRSHFPWWTASSALPEEMERWLRMTHQRLPGVHRGKPLRGLCTESHRGVLHCRYFPSRSGTGGAIRLLQIPASPNYYEMGLRRGLSTRESEILHYVAYGKRDTEIAVILGIATRTVSKHVERILTKMGTSSRTGAVTAARLGSKK
jgi:DNA-binding CsgD family transcriptional regulator